MHKHEKKFTKAVFLACILIILVSVRITGAATFTGEVNEFRDGRTNIYKIFFQDAQYRMEMKEGKKTLTVLVNRKTGKTQVLDQTKKLYREIENNSVISLVQNPFEAHLNMTKTYTVKKAGVEEVNGLACNKQVIELSGKDVSTAWVSSKYDFLIKMINPLNHYSVEIKGLRKMPAIEPGFFNIPKGYAKDEIPAAKAVPEKKKKLAAITTQEKIKAPVGRRVGVGGELVIQMRPENHAKIILLNKGQTDATVMVNPFREGIPVAVKSLKNKIINLKTEKRRKEIDFDEEKNPDSIAIKVTKGLVWVTVDQESPMWEKEKLQKKYLNAPSGIGFLTRANQDIICTITGSSQDYSQSSFEIVFFKDKYKTAIVKEKVVLKNNESKKWEFGPDKGILSGEIQMTTGGVQFSLRQPAPKKMSVKSAPPSLKETQAFSLEAPYGTSKTVDPKKPLMITLKASSAFSGSFMLYRDKSKKDLISTHPFQLDNGGSESFTFSENNQVQKVSFFVSKGSLEVKINQKKQEGPVKSLPGKVTLPTPQLKKAVPGVQTRISAASMILVLDASGSMWGQLNGKAKIVIAKEVMKELIDEIPENFQTGLTVYGHRRKGDCNDIEMILLPGPHNPAAMKKKIMAINPKGKTPLSDAVKKAAQALKYTEEKATVVLVSDGIETCHIDPCSLAAELAMTGVDFTIHVIGFDISKGDQERLRCLADKTGGLFLSADNAGSLRDALFKTVEKIKELPAPIVEDPGTATLKGPGNVPAGSAFSVDWEGPDSRGDYICLARDGSKDLIHIDYRYIRDSNPVRLKAPGDIGNYELRYVHAITKKVIGRTRIQVTPVQAKVEAPPSAKVASSFDVKWQGPGYQGDYIAIAVPEDPAVRYIYYTYTGSENQIKLRSPSDPGVYEVRYIMNRDTKLLAKTTITIEATTAQVQAPESAPVATQFEVSWSGPDNKSDYISIARLDQKPGSYVNYTYTKNGDPLKLRAPSDPGTYEIRYMQSQGSKILATTSIDITPVTASVQTSKNAAMGTKFEVSWTGPDNKSDYISIARPDQKSGSYVNYKYTSSGNPLKVQTPPDPGNYEVRYILGRGNKLLAKTTITIDPVTASVQAPGSAVAGSKFEVAWQGPAYKSDYISIARPDQKQNSYLHYTYVNNGNPVKLQAPAKAGVYEIRYIFGKGKRILAKTVVTIDPVTATVQAPDSAAVGSTIEISWTGPGYKSDYISIALPDQRSGSYKTYSYVRQGNPVKLKVPKQAGNYEVRYIMKLKTQVLAKSSLTVTP